MAKLIQMKRYLVVVTMFSILLIGYSIGYGQSSTNYSIEIDVFSGGGGDGGSTHYDLFSLMGQPSAIGTSTSSNYNNYAGFIWALVGAPVLNLCEGDFDHDGDVDGSDLAVFAADFGRTDCNSPGVPPCEGDFDHDGDVDGSDLAVFAADFGRTDCP